MNKFILRFLALLCFAFWPFNCSEALEPGALLYRTTDNGKMYGYNSDSLLDIKNGVLTGINPGHVGIYIGEENGEHFIVEALASGIVKTPAKYFINESLKEEFLGAKIPKEADIIDKLKAVKLAKSLVGLNLNYDFNFYKQKGPDSGDWTCVGLVEKIYESVNKNNPYDWTSLEYNPNNYGLDITPDGFDNYSVFNNEGDCFSQEVEFSKIARRQELLLPLPEIVGFNAGLEYRGERYIFLPYTQFIQPTLKNTPVNISISSNFEADKIRGKTPVAKLLLRWSLINNPISTVKNISDKVSSFFKKTTALVFDKQDNNLIITEFDNQGLSNNISDNQIVVPIVKINTASNNLSQEKEIANGKINNIEDKKLENQVVKINILENQPEKVPKINLEPSQASKSINENVSYNIDYSSENSENKTSYTLKPESIIKINSSLLSLVDNTSNQSGNVIDYQNIEYQPNQNSVSKILAGLTPSNTSPTLNTNTTQQSSSFIPMALISKIYATDSNDFIELYNPLDYDFDLAEASFRLEKSKTAEDPSLMMRIGNTNDGFYPGGTIIKSKGYYLIVRDDASDYYLSKADAIATRNEFSWTGSGYIIYLGKGAISSSADEDILDAVGFGAAKYFQGSQPAPVILDNYFLDRVSNLNDNFLDFKLSAINDPNVSWDDTTNLNNNNDNENQNNHQDNEQNNQNNEEVISDTPDDFIAFTDPEPFLSSDIAYFRNFSECYGENTYSVGRFDCGLEFGRNYQDWFMYLAEEVDINSFSLGFFYRDSRHFTDGPNLSLTLRNDTGKSLNLQLFQSMLQIEGLPNSAWRYHEANLMPDNNWHHFLLTVSKEKGYWAVYIDGLERYRHTFIETLPSNLYILEIKSDVGSVGFDEFAIWNKSLSILEINEYISSQAPLFPAFVRTAQLPAELKYFWDFNEGHTFINEGGGQIATDRINGLVLNLPENSWIWRDSENTGIINRWGNDLEVNFPQPLSRQDFSLSFWWRGGGSSFEGRTLILLKNDDSHSLGIAPAHNRLGFFFNDQYGIFSEGDEVGLPHDENWHHFALTYDSYRYLLKLYINGEEKKQLPFFWIRENNLPSSMSIQSQLNNIGLDDIAIWEGALTPGQIKKIFEET